MPTVLITGANRGVGLEFTRQYAADGWDIIACCRQPTKADKLQALARTDKKIRIQPLDVADFKAVTALAGTLKDTPLDLLINNAGVFSGLGFSYSEGRKVDDSQEFGSLDSEAWDRVLRTNTIAPIMMTQAFVPHLAKGKDSKAIMISSGMGSIEKMGPGYIAYCTSKAALNAAMRNIAHNLKQQKIAAACFHPGWVQTDMGGTHAQVKPEDSVSGMRKVIAGLTLKQTGQFINYKGEILPW